LKACYDDKLLFEDALSKKPIDPFIYDEALFTSYYEGLQYLAALDKALNEVNKTINLLRNKLLIIAAKYNESFAAVSYISKSEGLPPEAFKAMARSLNLSEQQGELSEHTWSLIRLTILQERHIHIVRHAVKSMLA